MTGTEIERKFLVDTTGETYKKLAHKSYRICQGYICRTSGKTVRVRIRDNQGFLTIKGPSADGIGRYEFEKEIPLSDAQDLMLICEPGIIRKTRWLVPCTDGKHTWEVDVHTCFDQLCRNKQTRLAFCKQGPDLIQHIRTMNAAHLRTQVEDGPILQRSTCLLIQLPRMPSRVDDNQRLPLITQLVQQHFICYLLDNPLDARPT